MQYEILQNREKNFQSCSSIGQHKLDNMNDIQFKALFQKS